MENVQKTSFWLDVWCGEVSLKDFAYFLSQWQLTETCHFIIILLIFIVEGESKVGCWKLKFLRSSMVWNWQRWEELLNRVGSHF